MFPGRVFRKKGAQTDTASIEIDPGEGNLSAKAYLAAVVGPSRLAYGKNTSQTLSQDVAQLVRNSGAAAQWAYVAVMLPGNVAGPKVALFSGKAQIGFNTAIPVSLQRTVGAPGGNSFAAVLQPGEMLYASAAPGEAAFMVITSVVWF